jgi:N-methylhydantoinase A
MGLLAADLKRNDAITRHTVLEEASVPAIVDTFSHLRARADHWVAEENLPDSTMTVTMEVDARYVGQNYELSITVHSDVPEKEIIGFIRKGFEALHRQMYGYVDEGGVIQIITFRAEASATTPKLKFDKVAARSEPLESALIGQREVWFAEANGFVHCPVYDREKLFPGHEIEGPAVIEQMDTTTVVLDGMTAKVDPYLNLILEDSK